MCRRMLTWNMGHMNPYGVNIHPSWWNQVGLRNWLRHWALPSWPQWHCAEVSHMPQSGCQEKVTASGKCNPQKFFETVLEGLKEFFMWYPLSQWTTDILCTTNLNQEKQYIQKVSRDTTHPINPKSPVTCPETSLFSTLGHLHNLLTLALPA